MTYVGLLGWVLGGCSDGGDPYCTDPIEVVSSSDSQPGTLRAGIKIRSYQDALASRADGSVVCLTCTGLMTLDSQLREKSRIETAPPTNVVTTPDGSIYATTSTASANGAIYELVAVSPENRPKWQVALPAPSAGIVADARGPYVQHGSMITGFDAATGESRTISAGAQKLIGGASDGVFTVEETQEAVTLRHIASGGDVVWQRMVKGGRITGSAAAPGGGHVFIGGAGGPLDLGDRVLPSPDGKWFGFVVGIDPGGVTQWAFAVSSTSLSHVAVTPQGDILLAGSIGIQAEHHFDAFLSTATPAGLVRTLRFSGPSDQEVIALTASPDGLAWVMVSSRSSLEGDPAAVLEINGHEFDEPGDYLFGIVP
jgi:hypothetical protein